MTSRRHFLGAALVGLGGMVVAPARVQGGTKNQGGAFRYALNTGTIRGYKLTLRQQILAAIAAGYQGIEPWISDLQTAAKKPGELAELKKICADAGLAVIGAIGFAPWAVNDVDVRRKGVEQLKREMALVSALGGTHIAAPPAGAYGKDVRLQLDDVVERYRTILELGGETGVMPMLEFWGKSANLSRLNECLYVAAGTGHPKATILADLFHMYTGGSPYAALGLLSPAALPVLHVNDYPRGMAREKMQDGDRVWPGDGAAPMAEIFSTLKTHGLFPWLSVEIFQKRYWNQMSVEETLRTGLAKMKAVAEV